MDREESCDGCTRRTLLLSICSYVYNEYAEQSRKSPAQISVLVKSLFDTLSKHLPELSVEALPKRIEEETGKLLKNQSPISLFLDARGKTNGVPHAHAHADGSHGEEASTPPQAKRLRVGSEDPSSPSCPLLSRLAPCIPPTVIITPSSCIHYLEEEVSSSLPAFSMICCMLLHSSSCREGCTSQKYCVWFHTLLEHASSCSIYKCLFTGCRLFHIVISHIRYCKDTHCPACTHASSSLSVPLSPPPYPQHKHEPSLSLCLLSPLLSLPSFTCPAFFASLQQAAAPWWRPGSLKVELLRFLAVLHAKDYAGLFLHEVDPTAEGCADYYRVILDEMDLEKMTAKANRGEYKTIELFKRDVDDMIENCRVYNERLESVLAYADAFAKEFAKEYAALQARDDALKKKYFDGGSGRVCDACHGGDEALDRSSLHCCVCGSMILPNARYFVDASLQSIVCCSCFASLPDRSAALSKTALFLRENKEGAFEHWVTCAGCHRWFHKVCLFYNDHISLQAGVTRALCPQCSARQPLHSKTKLLIDCVPETELSRFIETHLQCAVERFCDEWSAKHNALPGDMIRPEGLSVRVMLNEDRTLALGPRVRWYFRACDVPDAVQYTQKCICLFQRIHSFDTLLFTMYVCESPAESQVNRRCVYIAYLDSVAYLTPACFRKTVHQEVLVSYLAFLQLHGYERAYIWACPPTKGDDYIFFSHPPEQRMPNGAVLQRWYHEALADAHRRGVVSEVTNLVDEFLTGKYGLHDAALLRVPLFPGDHWTTSLEEKCDDLFNSGGEPLLCPPGQSMGSVPPWTKKVLIPDKLRKNRKGKEKGVLMQKMYEGLKDQKAHLILAKLQPQCANCGVFLAAQQYFLSEEEQKPSRFVPIPSPACFCADCVQKNPAVKALKLEGRRGGNVQLAGKEPAIHSTVFATRSLFLNLLQENHLQFNTLRHAMFSSMMILYFSTHDATLLSFRHCSICNATLFHGILWVCPHCNCFHLCDECHRYFPHPHECVAFSADTNQPANPIEVSSLTTTAETHSLTTTAEDNSLTAEDNSLTTIAETNSLIAIAEANKEPSKPRRLRFQCEEEYHFDHVHDASPQPTRDTSDCDALSHACGCMASPCPIPECESIKAGILHCTTCCVSQCERCSHFLTLYSAHVKQCHQENCAVPHDLLFARNL